MTMPQLLITISAVSVGTMVTRFLSFILFPAGKTTPKYVQYLGKVLPPAALGLLVVYCLKDVDFARTNHGLPEIISMALVTALHFWKKNTLLSIAAGTICYMLLVQFVFI